ncbi:hypothetical protein BDZ97DRAFT_1913574 [Flammula alnicola]|nr:hypothetical protein BDZ97DRAFT_1913574 [Flammula alnicola]
MQIVQDPSAIQPTSHSLAVVPMPVDNPRPVAPPGVAPRTDVQVNGPNIAINDQMDLADDPGDANVSSTVIPNPANLVEPAASLTATFFVVTVGQVVGIFNEADAIAYDIGSQTEFSMRQFPNWHQALGYYIAHHGNNTIRIVGPAARQPPPSPGTAPNPVYIPSNAPTPAKVLPGAYGNPIAVGTPTQPRVARRTAAVPRAAASNAQPSATSNAASNPFFLPHPPKPIKSPAPSLATPTPAMREAAPLRTKAKPATSRALPAVLVPDSDPEEPAQSPRVVIVYTDSDSSDDIPGPRYPSPTTNVANGTPATPVPAYLNLRAFPAPSPLSSPLPPSSAISGSSPTPASPIKRKKSFLPLFEDDEVAIPSVHGPPTPGPAESGVRKKTKKGSSAATAEHFLPLFADDVVAAPSAQGPPAPGPAESGVRKKAKKGPSAATTEASLRHFKAIESCFAAVNADNSQNLATTDPSSPVFFRAQSNRTPFATPAATTLNRVNTALSSASSLAQANSSTAAISSPLATTSAAALANNGGNTPF